MTTISAESVLASVLAADPTGRNRIDTLLLRYPRWIHSEFMTHRVFSRNASSSRAIPVERLIQSAIDDPAVPLHWGGNQKGMQAAAELDEFVEVTDLQMALANSPYDQSGEFTGCVEETTSVPREAAWLFARDRAVQAARGFADAGYHKQLVNRLLEPFTHITVVVTATDWDNFIQLRNHPDAEPHMQLLARAIMQARGEAVVQRLRPNEWHLPFADGRVQHTTELTTELGKALALSVACCASTSYRTVEGFDMTMERARALFDRLAHATPPHASPFEHQAMADVHRIDRGWVGRDRRGNFCPGWVQYRQIMNEIQHIHTTYGDEDDGA
jgi:hypothetical protein